MTRRPILKFALRRAILATILLGSSVAAGRAEPFSVLAFTTPREGQAPPARGCGDGAVATRYDLQRDVSPSPALPPQLAICELPASDRAPFASPSSAPAEPGAVVGLYQKLGPLVDASGVPGSSAAPPISGASPKVFSLVVLSNPTTGQDAAFNDWYNHQHVEDVLRVPGFQTAQRFKLIEDETPQVFALPRYAVQFIFKSYDLEATMAEVRHRLQTGVTRSSPAFDMKSSITRYYEPVAAAK